MEGLTFNQVSRGSSPRRPTKEIKHIEDPQPCKMANYTCYCPKFAIFITAETQNLFRLVQTHQTKFRSNMKILSVTISKKLFFIFLINSIITVTISGMVIYSFLGLSGQFNFNSELSTYKSTLDSIRIEQSKLKGHAQSFY